MMPEDMSQTLACPSDCRIEEIPLGDPGIRHFAMFPWKLYRGDPCWTPPLKAELLGNRLLGMVGLLQPQHSYHRNAEVTHFMAWRGKAPVGRISAAVNHLFNEYHGVRMGFFGFFEVINDYEIARMLLDEARRWVKERGMAVLRGPGQYSTTIHERQGVLVEGFNYPPTFHMTHSPPFYAEFLDRYGFSKAKDYHSYIIDVPKDSPARLKTVVAHVRKRRRFETRPINTKNLRGEVRLMADIFNDAWAQNWGFLPITEEEASTIAHVVPFLDPNGMCFAFVGGEPAAVLGAIPDPHYCLRPRWHWYGDSDMVRLARLLWGGRRIPRAEIFLLGVRAPFRNWGLDAVLADEILEYGSRLHYQTCEASFVLEDNKRAIRALESMGVRRYKTWRIYDLPLE